jgi:hypothetical protein
MLRQRQYGFSPLTSTALLGLAGAATTLGAMPELLTPLNPAQFAPMVLLGAAAWLRRWRDRRMIARLRSLRMTVSLPMPPARMQGAALVFKASGPGRWYALRDGWQVELRRDGPTDRPWQIVLIRDDQTDPVLPLAAATSLDMLLSLTRSLLSGVPDSTLTGLLDCDLSFPLPRGAPTNGILAMAEGGYALGVAGGFSAIGTELAESLLRGSTVPAAL